jgi:hypothetical protein
MKMYGYFLVSYFDFYRQLQGERRAYPNAIFLVCLGQFLVVVALVEVAINAAGSPAFTSMSRVMKITFWIVVLLLWFLAASKYYTPWRIDKLRSDYKLLPAGQQTMWRIGAVLSILLPAIFLIWVS